jgi:uncharacterized protein (TIGR03086 family)
MDIKELFIRTNQALNDIVQQVKQEHMELTVPKHMAFHDGQTLRDSINICAYENACVPRMLAGEQNVPSNAELTEDYLKDDFAASFAALTESANQAVRDCDDLERTVHMSYATVPARDYLKDIVVQRSTAAFDIAGLAGVKFAWPDELVEAIWDVTQPYASMLREYGVFPPEVTVSSDASLQDKLIAMTGRQP